MKSSAIELLNDAIDDSLFLNPHSCSIIITLEVENNFIFRNYFRAHVARTFPLNVLLTHTRDLCEFHWARVFTSKKSWFSHRSYDGCRKTVNGRSKRFRTIHLHGNGYGGDWTVVNLKIRGTRTKTILTNLSDLNGVTEKQLNVRYEKILDSLNIV